MKFSSRIITSAALAGMVIAGAPAAANADAVDRALAALPKGQITCEQASKYWTNTADYNKKVQQARLLATVDPRGPQILAALGRVDEAANRCGLKGGAPRPGTNAPAPRPGTNAPAPQPGANNPAPRPAAKPALQLIPGAPVAQTLDVPGIGKVAIPDLWQMIRNWLLGFGIRI